MTIADRAVEDGVRRGVTRLESGQVGERLEGRARLAQRLRDPVELRLAPVVAANQRPDRAGRVLEDEDCALLLGLPLEGEGASVLVLLERDRDEVADLQELRCTRCVGPRPACGLERKCLARDLDVRGGGRNREDDSPAGLSLGKRRPFPRRIHVAVDVRVTLGQKVARAVEALPPRELPKPPAQPLLGPGLQLGVEGRFDLQAAAVEVLLAVSLLEVPADVLAEERRGDRLLEGRLRRKRLGIGRRPRGLGDVSGLDHPAQRGRAPAAGELRVPEG